MKYVNEYIIDVVENLLKFVVLRVLEKEGKPLKQTDINKKTGINKIDRASEDSKDWITHQILRILKNEKKVEQKGHKGLWEITKHGKEGIKDEIKENKS